MDSINHLDKQLTDHTEALRKSYQEISQQQDDHEKSKKIDFKELGSNIKIALSDLEKLLTSSTESSQKKSFSAEVLNQTQDVLQKMQDFLNTDEKILVIQMQIFGPSIIPKDLLLSDINRLMTTISKLKKTRGDRASEIEKMDF